MVEDQGKEMPSPSPQQPFPGKVCGILEQSVSILFGAKEGIPPSSGGFRAAPGPPDPTLCRQEVWRSAEGSQAADAALRHCCWLHVPAAVTPKGRTLLCWYVLDG